MEIDEEAVFSLAMRNLKSAADEVTPAWPCLSIGLGIHELVKEVQRN